jgi:hypothetical protein
MIGMIQVVEENPEIRLRLGHQIWCFSQHVSHGQSLTLEFGEQVAGPRLRSFEGWHLSRFLVN